MIVDCEYDPLPANTDADLLILTKALLTKNHTLRPSVFEVVQYEPVKQAIQDFIEENNFKNEIIELHEDIYGNKKTFKFENKKPKVKKSGQK
jgi:hypothetical protein